MKFIISFENSVLAFLNNEIMLLHQIFLCYQLIQFIIKNMDEYYQTCQFIFYVIKFMIIIKCQLLQQTRQVSLSYTSLPNRRMIQFYVWLKKFLIQKIMIVKQD
ncbi:hypothetical protein FGO68_gene6855 [Halteria grandinella]|uniref:Uncharacterized protein n=1 Tax=Halteria grandinella TaxID=5974 RepID=A0A8J8NBA9_HALGN|nr:hypothetical protein FGO68_gene6855 [Halteria grandinella]